MKLALVGGAIAVVVIAVLLLAGGQQQAQPDAVEVLAGAEGIVTAVSDSDVRWLQQLMAAWDIANRNYLLMAMPYSLAMFAAAVLGFCLLVAVVVLVRRL